MPRSRSVPENFCAHNSRIGAWRMILGQSGRPYSRLRLWRCKYIAAGTRTGSCGVAAHGPRGPVVRAVKAGKRAAARYRIPLRRDRTRGELPEHRHGQQSEGCARPGLHWPTGRSGLPPIASWGKVRPRRPGLRRASASCRRRPAPPCAARTLSRRPFESSTPRPPPVYPSATMHYLRRCANFSATHAYTQPDLSTKTTNSCKNLNTESPGTAGWVI